MDCKQYAAMFKAMGDETRVRVIQLLTSDKLCACQLLQTFSISQPTLSHHMQVLCDTGLVEASKDGKYTYYSINAEKVAALRKFMDDIGTTTIPCEQCECK